MARKPARKSRPASAKRRAARKRPVGRARASVTDRSAPKRATTTARRRPGSRGKRPSVRTPGTAGKRSASGSSRTVLKKARPSGRPHRWWARLPHDKLMKVHLRDLDLRVEGTWLEDCLFDLHAELAERDLQVRPHAWISDEWFSPVKSPGIAFPFYLAHPRLMRLERKLVVEVEGGTRADCMRILRHEAGHVVQHAFDLGRRRRWKELFGRSSTHYPSYYRPNPTSRNYVQHLRLWYAQSHPDEDFAETFAVWLTPRSNWRKRYAGWPALKKLEYVSGLMEEIAGKAPLVAARIEVDPLSRIRKTLGEHYRQKLSHYDIGTPTIYDRDLLRIFSREERHRRSKPASVFLRRNRARIRQLVSRWTGEYQLTLDSVLDDMILRCREMNLRAPGRERSLRTDFAVLLTAQTVHSLYSPSRRQWFAL